MLCPRVARAANRSEMADELIVYRLTTMELRGTDL